MMINAPSNKTQQRTRGHRGRPVLAMNGALAGAEWHSRQAAEQVR